MWRSLLLSQQVCEIQKPPDMDNDSAMERPSIVPNLPMRALHAFESAGRHLSFSRAAEELGTAQPSVSRHIAELERVLAVPLFRRHHRSVSLTAAGALFLQAVSAGLRRIEAGAVAATALAQDRHVVIACGHAVSQQFMLPRFEALRRALDEDVVIRVLTLDYHLLDRLGDGEADLVLTYDAADSKPEDRAVVFTEAVTPVCAPDFAAAHAGVLARPVGDWGTLPFLDLVQPSGGWATWNDWFEVVGHPEQMPVYRKVESYCPSSPLTGLSRDEVDACPTHRLRLAGCEPAGEGRIAVHGEPAGNGAP